MDTALFVEVDHAQCQKDGEASCGDVFRSVRLDGDRRLLAVLSDGLGSGLKASILANMTVSMALKFIADDSDVMRCAEVIMDALPVCRERRISYATFSIVDCRLDGAVRILEMGNPQFLLLRNGREQAPEPRQILVSPRWRDRRMRLYEFGLQPEDRLVLMSDGITQAALGSQALKLGWRRDGCSQFVEQTLERQPEISARHLAERVLGRALRLGGQLGADDDMTSAVLYLRRPRRTLLVTGPPFDGARDAEVAEWIGTFPGRTAICGGTTANIVSRELRRELHTPLGQGNGLPPPARMQGVDLVTEGILTLTELVRLLESDAPELRENAARALLDLLRESDVIDFVVGTRVNEAHQDPSLPVDLEIRRNIVRRIVHALQTRYMKKTSVRYV